MSKSERAIVTTPSDLLDQVRNIVVDHNGEFNNIDLVTHDLKLVNGHVLIKVTPKSDHLIKGKQATQFFIRFVCDKIIELRKQNYQIKMSLQIDEKPNFDLKLKHSDMDSLGYLVIDSYVGSDNDLNFVEKYIHLFSKIDLRNGAMTKLPGDTSLPSNVDNFNPLSQQLQSPSFSDLNNVSTFLSCI